MLRQVVHHDQADVATAPAQIENPPARRPDAARWGGVDRATWRVGASRPHRGENPTQAATLLKFPAFGGGRRRGGGVVSVGFARIRANPAETPAPKCLARLKVSEPGNFSNLIPSPKTLQILNSSVGSYAVRTRATSFALSRLRARKPSYATMRDPMFALLL